MSEMKFTASTQQAIEWISKTLIYPNRPSNWQQPAWCNFTWFTSIQTRRIKTIERNIDRGDIVRRDIVFFLASDEVARITMEGWRQYHEGRSLTLWAVQHVSYRLVWSGQLGEEGEWVNHQFMTGYYHGASSLLAPEG